MKIGEAADSEGVKDCKNELSEPSILRPKPQDDFAEFAGDASLILWDGKFDIILHVGFERRALRDDVMLA